MHTHVQGLLVSPPGSPRASWNMEHHTNTCVSLGAGVSGVPGDTSTLHGASCKQGQAGTPRDRQGWSWHRRGHGRAGRDRQGRAGLAGWAGAGRSRQGLGAGRHLPTPLPRPLPDAWVPPLGRGHPEHPQNDRGGVCGCA